MILAFLCVTFFAFQQSHKEKTETLWDNLTHRESRSSSSAQHRAPVAKPLEVTSMPLSKGIPKDSPDSTTKETTERIWHLKISR